MFHRILIPTDFSTASEWVFDDAVRIAATEHAELVILHIRMTRTSNPDELRFPADPSLYEYAEQVELDKLRERVQRANAGVQTRLVVKLAPDPGGEIRRTAREEGSDLIVMATHARHHVAHLIIGSTTRSVLTTPPAPILVIRYGIPKRASMKRLVVPVHPEQASHHAFDLAQRLAAANEGEVHLLTICADGAKAEAERLAGQLRARAQVPLTVETVDGDDVEDAIVRYGRKVDADVVVLNANQELSTLTVDVIRNAETPVLIVPDPSAVVGDR
jgi:nucleotide-binding universal stress UspA family protein